MAIPKPLQPGEIQTPSDLPTLITAVIPKKAAQGHNYHSGVIAGNSLTYLGTSDFAWFTTPDLTTPIRVSLSETIGGVFVDARVEVTHLPIVEHELGETLAIATELDPETPLYEYQVATKRSHSNELITYSGETLLTKLHRTPADRTVELIPGVGGVPSPLTPKLALEHILNTYGIPHDDVPLLLLRTAGSNIELHLEAFVYRPEKEPISIGELLESFLQPFRGYAARARTGTVLQIVSPFEPSALTLTHNDLGLTEDVVLDSSKIVNACEVAVYGWTFENDVTILSEAGAILRAGATHWATTNGRTPAMSSPSGFGAGVRELFNRTLPARNNIGGYGSGYYTDVLEGIWPIDDATTFQPGANIELDFTVVISSIVIRNYLGSFSEWNPPAGLTINSIATIPTNGSRVPIWSGNYPLIDHDVHNLEGATGRITGRWDEERQAVRISISHQPNAWARHFIGLGAGGPYTAQFFYGYAIEFRAIGTSRVWTQTETPYTARFGYSNADHNVLPGLGESHNLYDLRELKLDLGWFHISEDDAFRIARGVVEAEYNPRTERTVSIEPNPLSGGYRVTPDHLSQRLTLPSQTATLTEYNYEEAHAPGHSRSSVTITVTETAPLAAERSRVKHYGRAKFGVSRYGENRV